jgi:hypothetical protein
MDIGSIGIIVGFAFLYGVFLFWYGGRGKPISTNEVQDFLQEMRNKAGNQEKPESEFTLLDSFRELASSDDGREFYMVNLLQFRKEALYPKGSNFEDNDPMAANNRYNRAILPQLLKYGGHPVFASRVMGRFIHPEGTDDWDQVAIVRYRSRRDMLKMAIGLVGKDIDVHKWAALEKTQVFPVRPFLNLFLVRIIAAMLCFGLAALAILL